MYPDTTEDDLFELFLSMRKFDLFESLVSMFQLIGFETGKIKRILDDNLISWGYFFDHNPFIPHCNAHPNNFVVLDLFAPYNQFHNLLAPLDFDMAYDF